MYSAYCQGLWLYYVLDTTRHPFMQILCGYHFLKKKMGPGKYQ